MYKKNNIIKIVRIGIFAFALIFVLKQVSSALSFKYGDGILGIQKLYAMEENSIDVLALGSSHAFEDINTGVLFDSYGIAAYVLAGSVQPYWNTYYYLTEALKTQAPRLIILEAYASTFDFEYSDHSRIIKNNLGIECFDTLYESLKVSSPVEDFDDYLLNYRLWHSRYSELNESDFSSYYHTPLYQYYMGFGINFATTSLEAPPAANIVDTLKLNGKTEEYYRKIIELCISRNIPLLIIASPYGVTENEQKQINQAELIAKEYEIDFINFNNINYYSLMNLDFATDFADRDHLNYIGNVKYTNYLAGIIQEKYDLPDRRGNSDYEAWTLHSKDILSRINNQYLKEETDFNSYLEKLKISTSNYTVAILLRNNTINLKQYLENLSYFDINADELEDGCLYVIHNGQVDDFFSELCWKYDSTFGNNHLSITKKTEYKNDTFDITYNLLWNGTEYATNEQGICVLVYDNYSETLADICWFIENSESNSLIKKELL